MQEIYAEQNKKILQNKKKLEEELNVKIKSAGKLFFIEGDAEQEYLACQIIDALCLGFSLQEALFLKNEEFILEKLCIRSLTKRHDLERIRARVIGTKGKTKQIIETLGECFISLKDNVVAVIGRADEVKRIMIALQSLIQGKKQTRVYGYLEKERGKDKLKFSEDLGLKKAAKKLR